MPISRKGPRWGLSLLPALVLIGWGLAGCEEPEPEAPPQVRFSQPQEGDTVVGPDVQVYLESSGIEIVSADVHREGTGHHHIFVNVDMTPMGDTIPAGVPGIIHMGQGQTEFLLRDLPPGENRLIAVLADWAHIPLDPPAVDTIFITVEPAEDPEEEAPPE